MKLKTRIVHAKGYTRMENSVQIKEVMVNEDLLHPDDESIALGFRGKDSSGLVVFTIAEFEHMMNEVRKRTHLIKGFRLFGLGGAIQLKTSKD